MTTIASTGTTHGPAGLVILLLAIVAARLCAGENAAPVGERTELHFAFSKAMFADVNENDARAAMKVYTQTIGDQNGIYVSTEPTLLDGTNAITRAVMSKHAELFALTAEEFLTLEGLGLEGPFLCSNVRQTFTEVYLLLVREDSPVRQVADLKGRGLIMLNDVRSCLAMIWLEVLCHEQGHIPAARLLNKITSSAKPIQVVLPVFFGKTEACVITRHSFEVMCELNPQLKKQLRVVASSGPVLPAMTCFGRGVSETLKRRAIKAVELSSTKPTYRQLMTLFKSDSVSYQPLSALDGTRALVAKHRQICDLTAEAASGHQTSVPSVKEVLLK